MDKFYFYSSYARLICKLNHNEAGQVIKAMCAFIFHDKEPSEKTLPKAKALFYLLYEQLSEAKKKQIKSAKRGIEYFTFTMALARFFEVLDDETAGILIKQCSSYVFASPPLDESEREQVVDYFELIKPTLDKTIKQRENARKHNEDKKKPQMTLDKIREDFKEIRGHLSPDNDILKGVDLNKLYAFIKAMRRYAHSQCTQLLTCIGRKTVFNCKPFTWFIPATSLKGRWQLMK